MLTVSGLDLAIDPMLESDFVGVTTPEKAKKISEDLNKVRRMD